MLDEMEKNKGAAEKGWKETRSHDVTASKPPTLEEVGIPNKMYSSRVQTIGRMPEEEFEKHIREVQAKEEELTTQGIYKEARRR